MGVGGEGFELWRHVNFYFIFFKWEKKLWFPLYPSIMCFNLLFSGNYGGALGAAALAKGLEGNKSLRVRFWSIPPSHTHLLTLFSFFFFSSNFDLANYWASRNLDILLLSPWTICWYFVNFTLCSHVSIWSLRRAVFKIFNSYHLIFSVTADTRIAC